MDFLMEAKKLNRLFEVFFDAMRGARGFVWIAAVLALVAVLQMIKRQFI